MRKSLADKMLRARQATGMSTRSVAEAIKTRFAVSHATLANYEKRQGNPPIELLAVLADLYERPLNWFLERGHVLEGVRYRNLPSKVKASDRNRFESEVSRWLNAYVRLEESTGAALSPTVKRFKARKDEAPDELARRLREKLELNRDESISSVVDVLEAFGIRVIEHRTNLRIDGLAGRYGGGFVVVLNPGVSNDRSRLNAAHELGHILYGDCESEGGEETKKEETRAFLFASHFLLPNSQLKNAFKGQSVVRLVQFKERFGISLAAMVYRAEELGFITKAVAKRLWVEFSKRGWRRVEPGDVRPDRATRFEQILENALVAGKFSIREIATMAGTNTEDIEHRLHVATGARFDSDDKTTSIIRFPG